MTKRIRIRLENLLRSENKIRAGLESELDLVPLVVSGFSPCQAWWYWGGLWREWTWLEDGSHQLPDTIDVCWSRGWFRQDEMVETITKRIRIRLENLLRSENKIRAGLESELDLVPLVVSGFSPCQAWWYWGGLWREWTWLEDGSHQLPDTTDVWRSQGWLRQDKTDSNKIWKSIKKWEQNKSWTQVRAWACPLCLRLFTLSSLMIL